MPTVPVIRLVVGMMSWAICELGWGILSKPLSHWIEIELTLYCVPPIETGWAPPSLNWIGIPLGLVAKEPGRTLVDGTGIFWQAILALTVIGPPAFPPILILPTRQPNA